MNIKTLQYTKITYIKSKVKNKDHEITVTIED